MKTQIHIHGQKPYTKYPFPPSTAASWVLYSQGDWGWKMCPLSGWIKLALRPIWRRSFLVTCFESAPSLHLSFSYWRFRSSYSTSCGWVLLHSPLGWRISFCISDRLSLNKASLLTEWCLTKLQLEMRPVLCALMGCALYQVVLSLWMAPYLTLRHWHWPSCIPASQFHTWQHLICQFYTHWLMRHFPGLYYMGSHSCISFEISCAAKCQ
jgi:hypothetical protein